MKRSIVGKQLARSDVDPIDAQGIDARYGLEPIIDLGVSADDGNELRDVQVHSVECPYCGESFETPVDSSSGSARYVEDCQICCQPIEFSLDVDHTGLLRAVSTLRSD